MTPEEREYNRALERSLSSIEESVAECVSSLDKLRVTSHNTVARLLALDDLATQVETMSKTMAQVGQALGVLNDTVREIHDHWIQDSSETRRRLGKLEAAAGDGQR